jgi:transcriptional antiterminator RfaH
VAFWVAVRTEPHRDRLALASVSLIAETFAPRTRIQVATRWRTVALFPSYLFARVEDRWWPIERSLGVSGIIKFGALPARVPDDEIAALFARADADGLIRLPAAPPTSRLRPGTRVRVLDGALRGVEALYIGQSAQDRETILLTILGAARQVQIGPGMIRAMR